VRILLTSTHTTSFIREDIALLGREHDVEALFAKGISFPFSLIRRIFRADLTFTWFASVYSSMVVAAARSLGKSSVIVVGGVDAAKCPEIGYGIWLSAWKAFLVRYAVTKASRVLVVDSFLKDQLQQLARFDGGNIRVLPTGYDPAQWYPAESMPERRVLTVAGCDSEARVKMKGIPVLLRAAEKLPGVPFSIIGVAERIVDLIRKQAPPNVEILGFLPRETLLGYYQRSKVYCQPSYFEGLPNSICEAMLCGCLPVGSRVGGIPTAIGEHGHLVPYGKVDLLVAALQRVLEAPPDPARPGRKYITETFSLERRREGLSRILRELDR